MVKADFIEEVNDEQLSVYVLFPDVHLLCEFGTSQKSINILSRSYTSISFQHDGFTFAFLGKYRPGHPSSVNDPKTWKANFRCAINSLPDVVEVKEMNVNSKRGPNAYKVYTFLPPKSRKRAKRKRFSFLFFVKKFGGHKFFYWGP